MLNTKHFQPGGLRVFKHFGIRKLLCQHIYGRSTIIASMQCSVTMWECFMFLFLNHFLIVHLLIHVYLHLFCSPTGIISIVPSFSFPLKKRYIYLKSHYLFCSLFKNRFPPRGYKHFFSPFFRRNIIEKFQAGESGIVLKPLNARLSTCILKNEQKKRTKKREKKIKQYGEFKIVVFSE